ncbi:hypothetical protein FALCPG4_002123 [Fusarium falciforme]
MLAFGFSHPLVLLVLLLSFSQFLEAGDFSRPHQPKGKLKVRLDYALATDGGTTKRVRAESAHKWVFSTYLVFNEPVSSITSGQLKQIASDAIDEMNDDVLQYKPLRDPRTQRPMRVPGVMTIMAFDNEIILASSQKGTTAFLSSHPDNPVSKTLDLCQTIWKDQVLAQNPDDEGKAAQDHVNERKCGEISTFFQYYQMHDKKIADLTPMARVTTVIRTTARGNTVRHMSIPGCGTVKNSNPPRDRDDAWGCNLLVRHADIDADYFLNDVQAEPYNLNEIAGGIKKIGQIQMHPCSDDKKVLWSVGNDG